MDDVSNSTVLGEGSAHRFLPRAAQDHRSGL